MSLWCWGPLGEVLLDPAQQQSHSLRCWLPLPAWWPTLPAASLYDLLGAWGHFGWQIGSAPSAVEDATMRMVQLTVHCIVHVWYLLTVQSISCMNQYGLQMIKWDEIIPSSWCLWILLFRTESSQDSPKCHCCYRIELQCLEGKHHALYQTCCMSTHSALMDGLHLKDNLTHPVQCWGLQHICSLPSGRVERKTKGGVGSLLARPRNLERQVWLRKETHVHVAVSLTWGLMWCIITNYSTCIHSMLW